MTHELKNRKSIVAAGFMALAITAFGDDYIPTVAPKKISARQNRKPHWKELQTREEKEIMLKRAEEKRKKKALKKAKRMNK